MARNYDEHFVAFAAPIRQRMRFTTALAGVSVVAATITPLPMRAPTAAVLLSARPNVVLITADDMRPSDLRAMPFTRHVLARRGVTFTDAIAPFSLCCPARASILTGQYANNHGVRSNKWPNGSYWAFRNQVNTLPAWLRRRGYHTAFVGKFLNQYAEEKPARLTHRHLFEVPPGWTHWYALYGTVFAYNHSTLNVDTPSSRPHRIATSRYVTNYLTGITEDLIVSYHQARRPFFVWLSHVAPHGTHDGGWHPPIPDQSDQGDFAGLSLPRTPVYRKALNENTADKRGPMHALPPVSLRRLRGLYQRRLESLKSLDRSVRRVVAKLKHTGEFHNTVLIFTSDNGYGMGEHRWVNKDMPYDDVLRVPMIISAPGLKHRYRPDAGQQAHVRVDDTVTSIDIAPTITGATGTTPGRAPEGINMLLPNQNPDHGPGDRAVLIQGVANGPRVVRSAKFAGVRTDRWTWFGWHARVEGGQLLLGQREFYDRRALPSQTTNIHDTALFPAARQRLASLTESLWGCQGQTCIAAWR